MKKIISILSGLALTFVFVSSVSAAAPNWDLTGTWTFNDIWMGVPYVHTMNITSFNESTGEFSGTGFYNSNPSLTWQVSGVESGDDITVFHLLVLTSAPGVTIDGTGFINETGTQISGKGYQSNLPGDPSSTNIDWTAIGTAVKLDSDNDGVLDKNDLCLNTSADTDNWGEDWGTNRWQVMGDEESCDLGWYQNKPIKGTPTAKYFDDLNYTYGCNGHQILDLLTEGLGENAMLGHYKFGLSSSVFEEFHMDISDGVLDGKYLLDTVNVPSETSAGVDSNVLLESGVDYLLEASGTFTYNSALDWADAEWYLKNGVIVKGDTEGSVPYVLDVSLNGYSVNQDWGEYNPGHTYTQEFTGLGGLLHFSIYDSYNGDNHGSLTVNIYGQL